MSIKPPLKCPPDYSILAFRITECKKAGIVKGIETQIAIDLQKLFVPVTNYEERQMTLKAGETKKIDVSSIGEHWPLAEKFAFIANATFCGDGTSHTYSLYDENLNLIETMSFYVDQNVDTIKDFPTALYTAVNNSTYIKTTVTFDPSAFTGTSAPVYVTAQKKGVKYRHVFQFDTTGWGGYVPFPYVHPGNLVTPYVKYERPRVKIMLIYPDFYKANVLSTCGCLDASGDMKSNKKYIQYAYDDDYYRINNPSTPIISNLVLNNATQGTNWTWNQSSKDHIGYHFANGDLLSTSGNPLKRGIISQINGYFFATDITVGNTSTDQTLSHVWSPSNVQWRNMGDFYLHTTAQDVLDTDKLYIETLWLKNPHDYDLPVKIMLAS
jgi:hypothetical protein